MKIAVIGSYGVGLTMFSPRFPVAGETITGGPFIQAHGGKGSNQAVAAARLGASVAFMTAIGDDPHGAGAQTLWADEGVDAAGVQVVDAATMVGIIVVEPDGENRIIIAPGALESLTEPDIESFTSHIAEADVALVSLEIPVGAAMAALRIAAAAGTTTILNPAPAVPLPEMDWSWVDIITPNETEAAIVSGVDSSSSAEDLASAVHEHTGSTVVLTAGASGAYLADHSGVTHVDAVKATEVVDTTGAGDSFNGALAVGIAAGSPLGDAVTLATHAGAHTVSVAGVIPALATLEELHAKGLQWEP